MGGLEGFDELSLVEGLASGEMRAAFYYRTARWVEKSVADQPLLVLVDDLHWADPDSLGLLGFLCRRLASWRLAIVATTRPWPSDAQNLAEALTAQGRASTFYLEPLRPGAASAVLAEAAGRGLTRDESDHALAACAGNPFLLSQSGVSLRSHDGAAVTSSGRDGRLLVSRFGGLPADVLQLAQVASVVGTRFRASLVAAAAEVEPRRVAFAIKALIAAGLVRDLGGGQVEFVHPLFAQALYDDLPGTTRGQLHGQVMQALVASGADPAQAAAHAHAGHLLGDPDAVAVLEAAGRATLAAGGLESALVELRAAADLAGANAPPSLLVTLADTEVAAGNPERAVRLCELLLAAAPEASVRAQVLCVLGRAALATGRTDQFQEHFQAAAVAVHDYPALEVAVLGEAVAASSVLSDFQRVLLWAEQARQILDEHPRMDRAATDAGWAVTACLTGDPSGAGAVLDALADDSGESVHPVRSFRTPGRGGRVAAGLWSV